MSRVGILLMAAPMPALAHAGERLLAHDLWTAWEFDPGVVLPLMVTALLYWRGGRQSHGVNRMQIACFWSGWGTLVVALCSPLHPLGQELFSAHMTQHELLMAVAAPLLVLSRPVAGLLWGMPIEWRRQLGGLAKEPRFQMFWRGLSAPATDWVVHAIVLWAWHVPFLFQATLANDAIHGAQHLCFLISALLFWWSLLRGSTRNYGWSVLYLFTTATHTSILGALLTFSPSVWYPAYGRTAEAWGLTGLQDQQIGGLIMWVPAGLVYLAAGLLMFAAWLRESDAMLEGRNYAN